MVERGKSYEGVPPPVASGARERRVALVIGNSAYPNAPLRNPRNDAEAFAAKLRAVHPPFDVTIALDAGREAMENALEAFEAKLGNCDTALLFFAGHGLQVKGSNFLMPVDADIRQETHLRRRAFSLTEVLEIMSRRVRTSSLVFLDACRDNPFARSLLANLPDGERGRFLTRSGLAEVRAATGSFIAFATAPDNIAYDGTGANSPFTTALVEHMTTPGVSINDVMIAVRRDVLKATEGRQEPWDQSSLREQFRFCELPAIDAQIEAVQPPASISGLSDQALLERAALEYWEAVKGTTDPSRLREFLSDYGTSRMGKLAREALQRQATANWRNINQRDETALATFIDVYPGTHEIAQASALLATRRAEREALVSRQNEEPGSANKARKPFPTWLGLVGGAVCVLALIAIFFVSSQTEREKNQIAVAPSPSVPTAPSPSVSTAPSPSVSTAPSPSVSTPQPQQASLAAWTENMEKLRITEVAPHLFVKPLCPGCDPAGFYCRKPIRSVSDLKGKKVRSAFTDRDFNERLISIGAVPLALASSEIYQALQVGVIDCVGAQTQ